MTCNLFLGSGRNCGLELGHVGRHMTALDAGQLNVPPMGAPNPVRDPETDPIISCTEKQLAFYFWQTAHGSDELSPSGDEWAAFDKWWLDVVLRGQDQGEPPNFATMRDLCAATWFESAMGRFAPKWAKIVADGLGYGRQE